MVAALVGSRQATLPGEHLQSTCTSTEPLSPARCRPRAPLQGVTPAPNSVIDMLLRATNKETGRGLSDVQIAAQANTLIAGAGPAARGAHGKAGQAA